MIVPKPRKLSSGKWFIYLRLGGEKIPITAYTEKECIRQAELAKAEYRAGKREKKEEPNHKLPTLRSAIDEYIEKRNAILSPSTIKGYKTIQRTRFTCVMDKSLSDFREGEWQSICNEEAKICSAKTLKNSWALIASTMQDQGMTPPKVKLPQIMPNDRPFLEPDQIHTFIKAVQGTSVEIPALLALHSLRRSEILALKWENIDLKNNIIHIRGAAVMNEESRLVQKPENKNASSARDVPIIIDELKKALKKEQRKAGIVVSAHPTTICRQINKLCRKNELPIVGVHGLRHSFVSLAYHLDVPEKFVMQMGGWSDYQTMRKIYTHIAKKDIEKYTESFEQFFSEQEEMQTKT